MQDEAQTALYDDIPDEIDFSTARPNPYAKRLRKSITIRLDVDTLDYFKRESERTGIPYQSLINFYLMQCAAEEKKLEFS